VHVLLATLPGLTGLGSVAFEGKMPQYVATVRHLHLSERGWRKRLEALRDEETEWDQELSFVTLNGFSRNLFQKQLLDALHSRDPERCGELPRTEIRFAIGSLPRGTVPQEGTMPFTELQIGAVSAAVEVHAGQEDGRVAYGEHGSLLPDTAWRLLVNLAAYGEALTRQSPTESSSLPNTPIWSPKIRI